MSHFTEIKTEIRDIDALKKALSSMDLRLEHDIRCRYYSGDPVRKNVVRLPGPYDMALEKDSNGAYNISADFYMGHVEETIGEKGAILLNNYSVEKLKIEAKKMGCKVYKVDSNRLKVIDPKEAGKLEVTLNEAGSLSFKTTGFSGKSCTKFESLEKAFGIVTQSQKTSEYYKTEKEKTQVREWL